MRRTITDPAAFRGRSRAGSSPDAARRGDRDRGPGLLRAAAALAAVLALAPVSPLSGQDDREKVPRIPAGTPVVLAPVQSVRPSPGGVWPGGAGSREAALEHINAEVDFAVSEEPLASSWASPRTVVERADRNPMLKVHPRQMAYRGLLVEDTPEFLYDPLHSQLRSLTALLDARLVILPLAVWYERDPSGGDGSEGGGSAAAAGPGAETSPGRARMRLALLDVRRGAVLWRGNVSGDAAPPDSPAAVATLAANLIEMLTKS